jgi:uncharacterized protein (DUF1499 family)
MLDRKIISTQFYRDEARKLGYEFPDDIEQQIAKEQDAFAARSALELGVTGVGENA